MSDYDSTPSFYNTDNTFEKYLGQTSYYRGLQTAVTKLVGDIEPDDLVELGSGTGETAFTVAEAFPALDVTGVDKRESVIQLSQERLTDSERANLQFVRADFRAYIQDSTTPPAEMLVLLYSFHHIPDPVSHKREFLADCLDRLDAGAYVCLAETFLDTTWQSKQADRKLRQTWANRGLEGYASTFWSALDGLDAESITRAQEIGAFSRTHELEAGDNVRKRDDEYLVTMTWLTETATDVGFDVVLAEPTNALGDGVVLLQKPP